MAEGEPSLPSASYRLNLIFENTKKEHAGIWLHVEHRCTYSRVEQNLKSVQLMASANALLHLYLF